MSTTKQYRREVKRIRRTQQGIQRSRPSSPISRFERQLRALADNEEWLANNLNKTLQVSDEASPDEAPDEKKSSHVTLAAEEEHVLRCLGAAVIMHWNTISTKLQRSSLTPPDRWASCWPRPSCERRSPGFCTSTKTAMRKRRANCGAGSLHLFPIGRFGNVPRDPRRRQRDRYSDDEKPRQMMRADKDRIEVQRQRQHHHRILRARRKRDHDIGDRKRQKIRVDQNECRGHRHRHGG